MMTMDQARAEAHRRWHSATMRGCVWHTMNHRRAVDWKDDDFRYCMGIGDSWEEAFANVDARLREEETSR